MRLEQEENNNKIPVCLSARQDILLRKRWNGFLRRIENSEMRMTLSSMYGMEYAGTLRRFFGNPHVHHMKRVVIYSNQMFLPRSSFDVWIQDVTLRQSDIALSDCLSYLKHIFRLLDWGGLFS